MMAWRRPRRQAIVWTNDVSVTDAYIPTDTWRINDAMITSSLRQNDGGDYASPGLNELTLCKQCRKVAHGLSSHHLALGWTTNSTGFRSDHLLFSVKFSDMALFNQIICPSHRDASVILSMYFLIFKHIYALISLASLNSLRPRQNGRHLPETFSNACYWMKIYFVKSALK